MASSISRNVTGSPLMLANIYFNAKTVNPSICASTVYPYLP